MLLIILCLNNEILFIFFFRLNFVDFNNDGIIEFLIFFFFLEIKVINLIVFLKLKGLSMFILEEIKLKVFILL